MPQPDPRRRLFLLAFSVTLLVFACLIGGAVYLLPTSSAGSPQRQAAGSASDPLPSSGYLPSQEESLTLLLAGRMEAAQPPTLFWLVGFEPVAGKVPVLALPADLAVGDSTLSQVWSGQGSGAAKQAVSSLLGVAVERTAAIDRAGMEALGKQLGAFSYALSYPVPLTAYGDTVVVEPGIQLLDGTRAADLLAYDQYPGGELTRLQVAAELATAALDQKWELVLAEDAQTLLTRMLGRLNTDLTAEDVATHLQAARFVAALQVRSATVVPFSGQQDAAGRWAPDAATLELTQTIYH